MQIEIHKNVNSISLSDFLTSTDSFMALAINMTTFFLIPQKLITLGCLNTPHCILKLKVMTS